MSKSRLGSFLNETLIWFLEGRIYIFGILTSILAIIFCTTISTSEQSVRICGYLLQMIGMTCAIKGVLSIRSYFQLKPYSEIFSDWIKRRPRWKKSVVLNAGVGEFASAGMKAYASEWTPDNESLSVEKRIEAIVKNLNRLRDDCMKLEQGIDKLNDSIEVQIKAIRQTTDELRNEIKSNLKELHTSDISVSIIGLILLMIGISLSTLSPEISKWLN